MQVIEYFESDSKELWKEQMAAGDWGAAKFLAKYVDSPKRESLFGPDLKVFLLVEGGTLIAFATLSQKDCIVAPNRFPWIGFVYTFPQHRQKGNSKRLLNEICRRAKAMGHSQVWLAAEKANLYEHYGFTYVENAVDIYGGDSLIYCKKL